MQRNHRSNLFSANGNRLQYFSLNPCWISTLQYLRSNFTSEACEPLTCASGQECRVVNVYNCSANFGPPLACQPIGLREARCFGKTCFNSHLFWNIAITVSGPNPGLNSPHPTTPRVAHSAEQLLNSCETAWNVDDFKARVMRIRQYFHRSSS